VNEFRFFFEEEDEWQVKEWKAKDEADEWDENVRSSPTDVNRWNERKG